MLQKNKNSSNWLEFLKFYIGLWIVAILLGAGFVILMAGFSFGFRTLIIYWHPASTYLSLLMGKEDITNNSMKPLTGWRAVKFIIRMVILVAIIYYAITIIFHTGFFGQNFVYLLMN